MAASSLPRWLLFLRSRLAFISLSTIALVLLGLLWAAMMLQSQRDQGLSLLESRSHLLNITRTFKEHACSLNVRVMLSKWLRDSSSDSP